jgi:hypothetical protein
MGDYISGIFYVIGMSQSLSCLLVHLIFSTKERHPFLAQNDLMLRTHAYLGGILREASCPSLTIGGTDRPRSRFLSPLAHTTYRENSRDAQEPFLTMD